MSIVEKPIPSERVKAILEDNNVKVTYGIKDTELREEVIQYLEKFKKAAFECLERYKKEHNYSNINMSDMIGLCIGRSSSKGTAYRVLRYGRPPLSLEKYRIINEFMEANNIWEYMNPQL